MPSPTLTLFELNSLVRLTIERSLSREYWVEAELSECRESRGHCYMELIQKEEGSATPIARASAKCWRSQWTMLQPYFERTTGQQLHTGMKVRLKVYAQFHEAFGFSWIVTDIDPTFTLGDMARRRQEIIRQLKEEGIFDLQKELELPLFCQHIAVISSETAAGYGDFVKQLGENPYGLQFTTQLFPAVMQGEQVEQSVTAALDMVHACLLEDPGAFDAVVIIRGGGSTADLSGFDTLLLAEYVANFPLPVITGIGHDRDQSVIDLIACRSEKTPTAVAAFLIDNLAETLERINDCAQRVQHVIGMTLERERERTGIKKLKVGYNKVFGYYIDIPNSAGDVSLPEEYIRKQTLVNGERYFTPELKKLEDDIINARDRIEQLEILHMRLFVHPPETNPKGYLFQEALLIKLYKFRLPNRAS